MASETRQVKDFFEKFKDLLSEAENELTADGYETLLEDVKDIVDQDLLDKY